MATAPSTPPTAGPSPATSTPLAQRGSLHGEQPSAGGAVMWLQHMLAAALQGFTMYGRFSASQPAAKLLAWIVCCFAQVTDSQGWVEVSGLWLRPPISCRHYCRAGLVVVLLGVGATLVFTTSQIGQ